LVKHDLNYVALHPAGHTVVHLEKHNPNFAPPLDLAENIFETHFWVFFKEKYPAGHIKATWVLEKSKKKISA
jgi:hypothetical protein